MVSYVDIKILIAALSKQLNIQTFQGIAHHRA